MTDVKPIKVYKHSGLLINVKNLEEDDIRRAIKRWTVHLYQDKTCAKCPFLEDRPGENCETCSSYMGARKLAKIVERGNQRLLSLPYGDTQRVRAFIKSLKRPYEVVDRTAPPTPLSRRIKMTIQLYPFQEEAKKALIEAGRGVLNAPPRAGKTVAGAALICEIGCKAIIIASQRDWLNQFRETFIGSATAKACTNAKPEQIRFCKTYEDFANTDIALATPQQFMTERGQKLLKRISALHHVLLLDEVHLTPALATSRVISQFTAKYRFGLSGTTERKQEGLYSIVEKLVGPVVYKAKVERLRPSVEVMETGVTIADPKGGDAGFARFVTALESSAPRRKKVVERVVRAVKEGHLVLLPVQRVKIVDKFVKEINAAYGKRIALPFTGRLNKVQRPATIEAARNYKCKVLVGQIRLLSTGLNIPRASCIIEYTSSSNRPQAIQRVARILTPMDGKPQPLIVFVCDESGIMRKMRRSEWWHAIRPEFNPIVSPQANRDLMAWFAAKTSSGYEGNVNDII